MLLRPILILATLIISLKSFPISYSLNPSSSTLERRGTLDGSEGNRSPSSSSESASPPPPILKDDGNDEGNKSQKRKAQTISTSTSILEEFCYIIKDISDLDDISSTESAEGAINDGDFQVKKRDANDANLDPDIAFLTAKQNRKIRARELRLKRKAELDADPAAMKNVKEKKKIYVRGRRKKKKAEHEVDPAAKKRAKEKKRAEDARYRMKRDKELEADPVKKQAMYLRQKEYYRKRYLKRIRVSEEDDEDDEEKEGEE
jgi:hypothetical protein